jgi:hypothetical protein
MSVGVGFLALNSIYGKGRSYSTTMPLSFQEIVNAQQINVHTPVAVAIWGTLDDSVDKSVTSIARWNPDLKMMFVDLHDYRSKVLPVAAIVVMFGVEAAR